jgi:outer membrane protein, protease secretion system
LPVEPADLQSWESLALSRSPEIETRRHAVEAARQALERTEAQRQPRVDMLAALSKADSESINTVNQSSYHRFLGLQLSVPLFDNGRIASQSRQAVAAVGVAEAAMDDVRETVLGDLLQQYRALVSEGQKIAAYTDALKSATLQVEATRQSVKGGIRITLDVLNAQTQQFSVQQELTLARFNYLKAWVRLRAAAGVLEARDLALIDQHLQ